MNLEGFNGCRVSHSEVQSLIIRRCVTTSAQHVPALASTIRAQINCRAYCIARRFRAADKFQPQPMMMVRANVAQQYRGPAELVDDYVSFSIVKQISKCRTARDNRHPQPSSLHRRNDFKLPCFKVVKQQRTLSESCSPITLIHVGIHVTVGDQEIQPSVVVIIEEAGAPSEEWNCDLGNRRGIAYVSKVCISLVPVKRIVIIGENCVV